MPEDVDTNLDELAKKAELEIKQFGGQVGKIEKEPVGFGLVALKMIFVMDESLGGTDDLEENISKIAGIQSCSVTDCRRAIG